MPMDEWEIHPDDLSPAQREVADLIGFENYLKLIRSEEHTSELQSR